MECHELHVRCEPRNTSCSRQLLLLSAGRRGLEGFTTLVIYIDGCPGPVPESESSRDMLTSLQQMRPNWHVGCKAVVGNAVNLRQIQTGN